MIKKTLLRMQDELGDNPEGIDHLYALPLLLARDLYGYGADTALPQGAIYKWDTKPRPSGIVRFFKRLMRRD